MRFDSANDSSISLIRDDSATPSGERGASGIGLGFSAPAATVYPPHSVRAGLASSFSAATAPAAANSSSASTRSSLSGIGGAGGPSPFTSATTPYALSVKRQRATYQQAFLRHSWNRIDALAVTCFWVSFALAVTGKEAEDNLWFFRALSVLRATRLLAMTAGTQVRSSAAPPTSRRSETDTPFLADQTILHSLKRAGPLLVKVGLFVAFAMVLFRCVYHLHRRRVGLGPLVARSGC